MEWLGCWQLLGPHRASRASTHFTPLPPPSVFLSAFSLWCLRIVMQSSPGRDGGVLLSLDISKISCLRDACLISGLSHHLRFAPRLKNMQTGIWNHIQHWKIWPCGWPFQTSQRDGDSSHDSQTIFFFFFFTKVKKTFNAFKCKLLLACVTLIFHSFENKKFTWICQRQSSTRQMHYCPLVLETR